MDKTYAQQAKKLLSKLKELNQKLEPVAFAMQIAPCFELESEYETIEKTFDYAGKQALEVLMKAPCNSKAHEILEDEQQRYSNLCEQISTAYWDYINKRSATHKLPTPKTLKSDEASQLLNFVLRDGKAGGTAKAIESLMLLAGYDPEWLESKFHDLLAHELLNLYME